jgi:bifunctional DNase/RNase
MDIPVELSRIIINETSDQQIIVVKEKNGERSFPIVIGIVEIFAIDRRLKGIMPPRPMTHDLLENVITAMGGTITKIVISDLQNHTFFATISIEAAGETYDIDARPSDAIALGVATNAPLFVDEAVFEKVLKQ